MAENFVAVAKVEEIPVGQARTFVVGERRVAVCNVEGVFYAVDDVCTHDNGPLGSGYLEDHAIECPRHGAKFDVRSGAVLQMPAVTGIRTYPAKTEHGKVLVSLGDDS
jgi:3-phenylpropionate/trans-cinnamate dioxygenase ferredoxin subunit